MIPLEKHHQENIELALATYPNSLGHGKVRCDHYDMAREAIDVALRQSPAKEDAPGRRYARLRMRQGYWYQAIAALLQEASNDRDELLALEADCSELSKLASGPNALEPYREAHHGKLLAFPPKKARPR